MVQLVPGPGSSTVMPRGRGAAVHRAGCGHGRDPPAGPCSAGRSRLPIFWRNSDLFF